MTFEESRRATLIGLLVTAGVYSFVNASAYVLSLSDKETDQLAQVLEADNLQKAIFVAAVTSAPARSPELDRDKINIPKPQTDERGFPVLDQLIRPGDPDYVDTLKEEKA